jgi:AhpD family alkylhydroperoxidase
MTAHKPRIPALNDDAAPSGCRAVFQQLYDAEGLVPNLVRVVANSPAVLEGYQQWTRALEGSSLDEAMRRRIALAVASLLGATYCMASNRAFGRAAGLSDAEIADALRLHSPSTEIQAVFCLIRLLIAGERIDDCHLTRVRRAGWDDGAIVEIVAIVSTCLFHAMLDRVARVPVDFPETP